ncbi:MAG: peptidylprolyl isomerase [Holophagales bacterium]|nr:peptidylprolyl isomerase [Holophagales bacterium]
MSRSLPHTPRFRHRALGAALLLFAFPPAAALAQNGTPPERPTEAGAIEEVAVLDTNHGRMVIRFFPEDAPKTVAQIQKLIRDGFYDGKAFYRVVEGHVIQTGDKDGDGAPNVPLEAGRPHVTGAVGLARGNDPSSGTTEIYICHAPRPHLDGNYAVFGQVVEGLDVLDAIGKVPVNERFVEGGVAFHEPKEAVLIEKAVIEERRIDP